MHRLYIYDKKELEMGIKKEMEEHGMSEEQATKTAKDHLKENPKYYSIATSVGLEDETLHETSHMDPKSRLKKVPSRLTKIKQYAAKHKGRPFTVVGTSLPGPR